MLHNLYGETDDSSPRAWRTSRSGVLEAEVMDPKGGGKPSKTELVKIGSQYLRGPLADEIRAEGSHISEDAASVLKFHGSYQQDDRDLRTQMKREGKEKAFQFM